MILSLAVLFLLMAVLLLLPGVQTFVARQATQVISGRTDTEISIERIGIRLPGRVGLRGLYIEDMQGDTLIYANKIDVKVRILSLLRNRVMIDQLSLADATVNIIRTKPDTLYNIDQLIQAIAGGPENGEENEILQAEKKTDDAAQKSAWTFDLGRLSLDEIRFRLADHYMGMDLALSIGHLDIHPDHIDFDAMQFLIDDILIQEGNVVLLMDEATPGPKQEQQSSGAIPAIGVGKLLLNDFSFSYQDHKGFELYTSLGNLEAEPTLLDLDHLIFDFDRFFIDGLLGEIIDPSQELNNEFVDSADADADSQSLSDFTFQWKKMMPVSVRAVDFELRNGNFTMRGSHTREYDPEAFNPANIHAVDIGLHITGMLVTPDTVAGDIRHLGIEMPGSFKVVSLSGQLALGQEMKISSLYLETMESLVEVDIISSIPVLNLSTPLDPKHSFDLSAPKIRIGNDLAFFIPAVQMLYPDSDMQAIELSVYIGGYLDQIAVHQIDIGSDNLFQIAIGQALIRNWPDMDSLHLSVPEFTITANPKSLAEIFPDLLPGGLKMPDTLVVDADLEGFLQDFIVDAAIHSDFADLQASLEMKQLPDLDPEWQVLLEMNSADILEITGQPDLIQDIGLVAEASGRGFDPKTMVAEMKVRIDSLSYNNYIYKNLRLEASAGKGAFSSRISYGDEHLTLEFLTEMDLSPEHPHLLADWVVEHLNAQELGFTDDLIALQTNLAADVVLTSSDFFEGSIRLDDTYVLLEREVYALDSLLIVAQKSSNRYHIDIYSPFVQSRYRGSISPVFVPEVLVSHINSYIDKDPVISEPVEKPAQFNLALDFQPSPYITSLLFPQIESYQPLSLSVSYDGETSFLFIDADMSELEVMGVRISDMVIKANSDPDYLDFLLRIPALDADQLDLRNIVLSGNLQGNELDFGFSFDDDNNVGWLGVSGVIGLFDHHMEIRLDPEIVVNRQDWKISPDNFMRIGSDKIFASHFEVVSGEKAIYLKSLEDQEMTHPPLEVGLQNIDLGAIDLIGGAPIVEGVFTGGIVLMDVFSRPAFTADFIIDGLGIRGDQIGDLRLMVQSEEAGMFNVEASVSGYGNVVDVTGFYYQEDPPRMDFDVSLKQLDLSTLEALTFGQLKDMQGLISGSLHVTGNPQTPGFDGVLNFEELAFFVTFLNTPYRIAEETIVFDNDKILFDRFSLVDKDGREASLDGFIDHRNLEDIRFGLQLASSNFLAMDIPEGANDLFYGTMLLDTDLNMTGNLSDPVVEGRLKMNRGSSFALIVPQTTPQAIGDDGVVDFFSLHEGVFSELLLRPDDPEPVLSTFRNLDMSINIDIDPQTLVTVIVDEHAGDQLEIRGGGVISYGVDPGGRVSLSGRYDISEGAYQMTFYDVISRNFSIRPGGSIVWTGDPLDAVVDITASYNLRTSVRELMATHAQAGGHQEAGFRRQYPFDVLLHMKGELMQPDIRFGIELPPEHRGAMEGRLQTRLDALNQNESELNKQVFALLILGSFIQDDPLAGVTGGPGIGSTARASASRLLSQQLNRLSDRYIRGIDLSFEVESFEDFDDGQLVGRTELQMEVSRDFFDERLRVTAGGHLELEDETRRQLNPADIVGDFSVEYLLLPDGRLILKGFRERNFQDIYDGELVETGIALIFTQSFDRFREIFRRRPEEENQNER